MRRYGARRSKQDALYYTEKAFEDWKHEQPGRRAEIKWCHEALRLDQRTEDELKALEYVVNIARRQIDPLRPLRTPVATTESGD
jgi:hypothetical protein